MTSTPKSGQSVSHGGGDLRILETHFHGEEGQVRVTLNVPLAPEGLAGALYMDGSGSMEESGNYGKRKTGLFSSFGKSSQNRVQDAMRLLVPYIAGLDANGKCRIAYWACGSGWDIQVIGELDAATGAAAEYPGPNVFGRSTQILPAVRDFVTYVQDLMAKGEQVQNALLVLVTDGLIHDEKDLVAYCTSTLVPAIDSGKFPFTNISIVGVGPDVNREQLDRLHHACGEIETMGVELVHDEHADDIDDLARVVAHLISAKQIAFEGGATVVDQNGKTVAVYENAVPAVLTFPYPAFDETQTFTLVAGDNKVTFTVDPDDDED